MISLCLHRLNLASDIVNALENLCLSSPQVLPSFRKNREELLICLPLLIRAEVKGQFEQCENQITFACSGSG